MRVRQSATCEGAGLTHTPHFIFSDGGGDGVLLTCRQNVNCGVSHTKPHFTTNGGLFVGQLVAGVASLSHYPPTLGLCLLQGMAMTRCAGCLEHTHACCLTVPPRDDEQGEGDSLIFDISGL